MRIPLLANDLVTVYRFRTCEVVHRNVRKKESNWSKGPSGVMRSGSRRYYYIEGNINVIELCILA